MESHWEDERFDPWYAAMTGLVSPALEQRSESFFIAEPQLREREESPETEWWNDSDSRFDFVSDSQLAGEDDFDNFVNNLEGPLPGDQVGGADAVDSIDFSKLLKLSLEAKEVRSKFGVTRYIWDVKIGSLP